MDIKEYISSGIIERYAMGAVTSQEKQEVECMAHIYPEVKEELDNSLEIIEELAMRSAIEPPKHLKALIFEKIKNEKIEPQVSETKTETKVVKMPIQENTSNNFYKYLSAASVLLLIGAGFFTYQLYTKQVQTFANLNQQVENLQVIQTEKEAIKNNFLLAQEQLNFLSDNSTRKITMNGTENYPDLVATVFWNNQNSNVKIEFKNLPTPPANKQYQLWAIVNGEPKDLGLLDVANNLSILDMKPIATPQAFAITLEPIGGSVSPTLELLQVIGNV